MGEKIVVTVLETSSSESDLLFRLIGRSRYADVPGYQSVDEYSLEKGWVIFSRLDCSPAPHFKVAVAGNSLLVSQVWEKEVKSWLKDWKLAHIERAVLKFSSPEEALEHLAKMQRHCISDDARKIMINSLEKQLEAARKEEDRMRFGVG